MLNDLILDFKEQVAHEFGFDDSILINGKPALCDTKWEFGMAMTYRKKKQILMYEKLINKIACYYTSKLSKFGYFQNPIKINEQSLLEIGFVKNTSLIQDSFSYNILNHKSFCEINQKEFFHFKEVSLSICNDKGNQEYYCYVRDGYTENRLDDDVVCLSRNYQYIHQVERLIKCFVADGS
jgi:hypothetical protein